MSSRGRATCASRSGCSTSGTWPATRTSRCGCAPRCSRTGAATPGTGCRELQKLVRVAARAVGELAHASVPDLKEAEGGLRDATALKALVATWLVDVPHVDLERAAALLDVRDLRARLAGRATDRVAPEMWRTSAAALGLDDARAAQVARARARPPDHPPVPAHLAPGRRRARPAGPPPPRGARR